MRRLILEEPFSEAAVWSRRLGVFALLVAAIGALLIRTNLVEVIAGLAVFGAAIFLACAALLLAGAGMAIIWRTGRKGVGHVVTGILLSVALLAYPAYLSIVAVRLPPINDITTDVNDPPTYSMRPASLNARSGRTPGPITEMRRLEQQRAYADVQPIVIDVEAREGYALVREAVRALGWRIVEEADPVTKEEASAPAPRPPAPPVLRRGAPPVPPQRPVEARRQPRDGRIDAVDKSLIMGFPDDITIRIKAMPDQTRIDIRSASRYGRHDFGANARRIRRFATELQTQLDSGQ
jgi:hypothetical protein